MVSKISATGDSEIIGGFLEVAMGLIIMMQFFENGQRIGETGFEEIELMRLLLENLDFSIKPSR